MGESGGRRLRDSYPIMLRILLAAGFLIALAATGLVVLADDVRMLRLAAVLALWAALIAAFAVTRSRRDARAAAMRESEAQLAYQLELHREVAARREYEADLTRQVASAQSDQLADLRGQLERLTSVLSSLVDGELTVSRLTLSAESARFRSLAAAERASAAVGSGRFPAVTIDTVRPDSPEAESFAGRAITAEPGGPGIAETSDGAGSAEPAAGDGAADTAGGAGAVEPADGAEAAEATPPAEATTRPRPDAPAASWARRHRATADLVRTTASVTPAAAGAGTASAAPALPSAAAAPVTGAADAPAHDADRTDPATPVTDPSVVAEPEGALLPAQADGDADDHDGDDGEEEHPGDHESGVPLAELLAAYGLSGQSRRRRQE